MKIVSDAPKGFKPAALTWRHGPITRHEAGEDIWVGDGIKIHDGKAYRCGCFKAKLAAGNSAKTGVEVLCYPINEDC